MIVTMASPPEAKVRLFRALFRGREDVYALWLSTHKKGATFKEEQKLRNDFEEVERRIGLTTIQLAQGWDFESVILIVTQDRTANEHVQESILTGITRAKSQLRIIDASLSHWVYDCLKRYN